MKFEEQICSSILRAVKELYGQEVPVEQVQLQKTKSTFEGHLTLVVFPFVKLSKKKPEDTAQEIGDFVAQHCSNLVSGFNVVKGFLNFVVAPQAWVSQLNTIATEEHFG